jgi:hypothetical protein
MRTCLLRDGSGCVDGSVIHDNYVDLVSGIARDLTH